MPSPTAAPTFTEGDLLDGRWSVERVLPGAMGSVLILVDPASGNRFAAKTPRLDAVLDAAALGRFEVEARNWLTLGAHENVVEALFLEEIPTAGRRRPFLFLEYIEGPTLREVLDREQRLAVPVVLDVGTGMAWGLAHAHGEGRAGSRLVHRDLKPDNVFLTRHRVVKVSDFGLARALDRQEDVAEEGAGLGTPFYSSPEQLKDAQSAGPQADVYAYGAVLHHLLTGEPPFPADTLSQLVWKVLREAPLPPSARNPAVPPELDRLVLACLAKSPGERPRTFGHILAEISEIREIDRLWAPPAGARSCPSCGWLSARPCERCSVCRDVLGPAERYAPASSRTTEFTPTLGRSGGGRVVVEGAEMRPRVAHEGEDVVVTAFLANPGSDTVENVFVAHARPDRDAFDRPEGHRRGFRGSVPPTAEGAPLRVSWTVRPLVAGTYTLREVRATYRDERGRRVVARGPSSDVVVLPRDGLPLVGREEELRDLRACLGNAERGALAVVVGPRGLGKSRLARELRREADARGFLTARGRCLDRGTEVRGALKEALRRMLALSEEAPGAAATAAAIAALLGGTARPDGRLVDFLVAELLGRPVPRGESAALMWARFAEALGRRRPLLLVLEDVQRDVDVAGVALQMVAHAAHTGASVAIVLTARPELEDGALGRDFLERFERASEQVGCARLLRVGPLAPQAVLALVDAAFDPNDFATSAPWLARRLAELSGGSPLLAGELLRMLREAPDGSDPLVDTRGGRWTASPGLTPEALDGLVPPRIEELVIGRLRQLPDEMVRIARAAGVLGDVFEPELLKAVLPGVDGVDEALRRMERQGVLRETGGTRPRLRFREPLVPEILAREARASAPAEFERVNALAADWLLAREQPAGRQALRLARHLAAAGRVAEAFRRRLDAARRLVDRQSFRKAATVLRDADALLAAPGFRPEADDVALLHLLRGEALRFSGDYAGALDAYTALVGAAGRDAPPPDAVLASAYSKMGKVHEALGRLDEALRCFERGLELRRTAGLARDVPMSLVNLAGLHLLRGETPRAEALLDDAVAAATDVANPRALGRAHTLRARVLAVRGAARAARAEVRIALAAARAARDRTTSADAWNVLGIVDFREGRSTRAVAHFRRALRLRQEIGDLAAVAASWNNLAAVQELLGARRDALRGYERAVEIQRRIASTRGLGTALMNVGRMQYEGGRPRAAEPLLAEAVEMLRRSGDPVALASALAESARVAVALSPAGGDGERAAVALLDEALALAQGRGDHDTEAGVLQALAELHAAQGDPAAAAEAARTALALPGLGPRRRVFLLCLTAEQAGDAAAAAQATAIAEGGGGPRTRARALAASARVRLAGGDERGAAPLLRRAGGLLLQSEARDPLLLGVLRDGARALRETDPAAAAAFEARAEALRDELRKRGFVLRG